MVGGALDIGFAGASGRFLRTRRFLDSLESLDRSNKDPSDSLALLRLIDLFWVWWKLKKCQSFTGLRDNGFSFYLKSPQKIHLSSKLDY